MFQPPFTTSVRGDAELEGEYAHGCGRVGDVEDSDGGVANGSSIRVSCLSCLSFLGAKSVSAIVYAVSDRETKLESDDNHPCCSNGFAEASPAADGSGESHIYKMDHLITFLTMLLAHSAEYRKSITNAWPPRPWRSDGPIVQFCTTIPRSRQHRRSAPCGGSLPRSLISSEHVPRYQVSVDGGAGFGCL